VRAGALATGMAGLMMVPLTRGHRPPSTRKQAALSRSAFGA